MKNQFKILPFFSVGKMKFGMTQEEIERIEGKPHSTFNDKIMNEIRETRENFEIIYKNKKFCEITFSDKMNMKQLKLLFQETDLTEKKICIEFLKNIKNSKPSEEVKKCINFYGLGICLKGFRNKSSTGNEIIFFSKSRIKFYEFFLVA